MGSLSRSVRLPLTFLTLVTVEEWNQEYSIIQCSEILTDAQRQEFIRTIATMTAKRINKKQLEALLKEAGLKKTGNKEEQITRLQSHFGIKAEVILRLYNAVTFELNSYQNLYYWITEIVVASYLLVPADRIIAVLNSCTIVVLYTLCRINLVVIIHIINFHFKTNPLTRLKHFWFQRK